METILIFALIFVTFLYLYTLIFKVKATPETSDNLDREWHENYIEQLNQEIISKSKQLTTLSQQIEDRTIDKNVSLTKLEISVLDIYDASGIRIPSDIIEDLSYMRLDNEKAIMEYIENQRYFWKLENTKKPFKEVKQK